MMKRGYLAWCALLFIGLFAVVSPTKGQNVVGIAGGFGSSSDAIYPAVEGKSLYGLPNFSISWRNYTKERYVGCFGIDLEYIQRGFSYAPFASSYEEGEEMFYYSRKINTLMIPIVWQPHVYMLYRRVRLFGEAAATFSYDLNSSYVNNYAKENNPNAEVTKGDYEYLLARDNRLGYGLAFGGGVAVLFGRFEAMARVKYYWGLSDVVRNRNKYYSNNFDGAENPFSLSPIRSSLNSLMINFGVAYRFDPVGFKSWNNVRVKRESSGVKFNYTGEK